MTNETCINDFSPAPLSRLRADTRGGGEGTAPPARPPPEESLGISSEKYNEIVNECIFGEEKKSEWTEEDEELCQDALDAFEALANDLNPSEDWGKLYDWLKSLKQRMEKQQ